MGDNNLITIPEAEAGQLSVGKLGDVITILNTVTDVNEVLAAGFNRLILERSLDAGLSWTEVGTPDERLVLELATNKYAVRDRRGAADYLYRTRYLNDRLPPGASGRCSDASVAVRGDDIRAAQIVTIPQLKARYLFGLKLSDDLGNEIPDATYQHAILQAVRWMEHELGIPILEQSFAEDQDYYRGDRAAFTLLQLDNYPVQSVSQFRMQFPSGQVVVVFPPEWVRLDSGAGVVQIAPTAGTLDQIFIGIGGPYMRANLDYFPQLFRVEYTAGFPANQIPKDILEMIGMAASMPILHQLGDLIAGAGIATASLSMDGLSQTIGTTASATSSGFGSRIINYQKAIKLNMPALKRTYRRVASMVVA